MSAVTDTTSTTPGAAASGGADKPVTGPPTAPNATPAMRQYLEQKARVGDAILLFRIGDFYETFYDDAKTVSRVLGLTLTTRDKNSPHPVPLAGVPYHAVERYVARLVQAGYKVAISEQVEDPRQARGLVERDVTRIITPGTLVDDELLDGRRDNYLAALHAATDGEGGPVGLAWVELAGGRFFAQMLEADAVTDEVVKLAPAEVLVPEGWTPAFLTQIRAALAVPVTHRPHHVFDAHLAERRLCEHFRVATLRGFGFETFDASLRAAAAILDYLHETQKSALAHILAITPHRADAGLRIDPMTLRSLEIERTMLGGARDGSLLGAIDATTTPMGARLLRRWLCYPLRDAAEIIGRQEALAGIRDQPTLLRQLREHLRQLNDLERILARVGVGRASPRDLAGLGRSLELARRIADLLGDPSALPQLLGGLVETMTGHEELAAYLANAFREDAPPTTREPGFIADGHHAELDRLRRLGAEAHRWLAEYQGREAQRTGIPTLKVGYNSVFGYYIEITHQHREKVPPDYVRKQTVRNAERYITEELKRHEEEVTAAEDRVRALELELFEEIRERVATALPRLAPLATTLATLDVICGLAEVSRKRKYCRPTIVMEQRGVLEIVEGRHPVLDVTLAERFVPNDCSLTAEGARLLVITGPNMAGKSTYIRQVALLALMAQIGSDVPARSMRLAPVDRLFARVGAGDELARGQSTFMVEMVETARILHGATSDSLVILDEIGRGTSTYDGLAIAWAVTEHLATKIGCRALFATHYHELTELAEQLPGVANFNVAVREQLAPDGSRRDVIFLHKIVPGPTDRSYGVHVGAMAGLPADVVARSEAVLHELERSFYRASRGSGPGAGQAGDEAQMMLFPVDSGTSPKQAAVVEQIRSVDVNRMTPLDALALLQKLQALLKDEAK